MTANCPTPRVRNQLRPCECGGLRDRGSRRCWTCTHPLRVARRTEAGYEIPLTRGRVALVDEADLALVMQYSWRAAPRNLTTYASARTKAFTGYMHRLILQPPDGIEVDHVNCNGLDNRRINLRIATRHQNASNSRSRGGTSRFKGVSRNATGGWLVTLGGGPTRYVGTFQSEIDAARAYDRAALEAFGEFARTNEQMFGPLVEVAA